MKIYVPLFLALAVMTSTAQAQCFRCRVPRVSSTAYAYAPTFGSYCAPCGTVASYGCEVATPAPCEVVQTTPAPCESVTLPAPCEQVTTDAEVTCESVTGEYCPTLQPCPTGACPLRTAQHVASLLDSVNAVRARYRLPALTLDASLESGARYQSQICAGSGCLIHGSCAEILAQNTQGLETALNQWLNSPAHRALLLGSYRYAGVAVYRDSYGRAWCAVKFR